MHCYKVLILFLFIISVAVHAHAQQSHPQLIPSPQEVYWGTESWEIAQDGILSFSIELSGSAQNVSLLPGEIYTRLQRDFGVVSAKKVSHGITVLFALQKENLPVSQSLEEDEGRV